MITNACIWAYTTGDNSVWNRTSTQGATIKSALDFAMGIPAINSNEVAGKYADFLANGFPGYAFEAYFLWNQPLAGGMDESAAALALLGITGTEGVAAATALYEAMNADGRATGVRTRCPQHTRFCSTCQL
ncbi:hypothetical protein LshimejAT787_0700250 [Lyophyllum shimeji]|uniref:Uncharacterized protein n=1 Tax=Lyophyllum shimeji TaxID=47721 RepID=A0A9P3PP77_LYOSH|nr:hypothetical protein LshimejAT787_0700250 [Lyophyllum shimeji]